MKKNLPILLFLGVLLLLLVVAPNSPLSVSKMQTSVPFSKSPASQVAAQLASTKRAIEEVGELARGGDKNKDNIQSKLTTYEKQIDQAVVLAGDDVSLKVKILDDLAMHLTLFQEAYKKAADDTTREAIIRALERANSKPYKILVTLDASTRNQVHQKMLPKQYEAFEFLKKEATGSGLPAEYTKNLKKRVFAPPPANSAR